MVVCYFWYVTVTNLCHSNKFSLSNQQITFYSAYTVPVVLVVMYDPVPTILTGATVTIMTS